MIELSSFNRVRGMRDFLPEDVIVMKHVEEKARTLAKLYGYDEIVTPVVESYELLAAKAGLEVRLRMYAFEDLGGRKVALRPEFTPSVARLVATTLRSKPKPLRLLSLGSLYRYDEPQKGRFREFWQSNYELFGSRKPEADTEVLALTCDLMSAVGLKSVTLKVGHMGILRGILRHENIDSSTQERAMHLMDKNDHTAALDLVRKSGASERGLVALRKLIKIRGNRIEEILGKIRMNVENYEEATEAVTNLEDILNLLAESEEKTPVRVEAGFARGLEYYTGMIFEVYVPGIGFALGGGGRYDKLIELFGGESTPAVGVAHGIDRIALALEKQGVKTGGERRGRAVVIAVDEEFRGEVLRISRILRDSGIPVEVEVMGRRISRALEDADRRGVRFAIILGRREVSEGSVMIRDLMRREQRAVKIEDLVGAMSAEN